MARKDHQKDRGVKSFFQAVLWIAFVLSTWIFFAEFAHTPYFGLESDPIERRIALHVAHVIPSTLPMIMVTSAGFLGIIAALDERERRDRAANAV